MATDEVSGIEAPVVCRTLRANSVAPTMILLGDKPAMPSEGPERLSRMFQNDAEKLFMALYTTLPGETLHRLLREMIRAWVDDRLTLNRMNGVKMDVEQVLHHLDGELY